MKKFLKINFADMIINFFIKKYKIIESNVQMIIKFINNYVYNKYT